MTPPIVWQACYKLSEELSIFLELPQARSITLIKATNLIRLKLQKGENPPFVIPDKFLQDSLWLASHFIPFELEFDKLAEKIRNKRQLNHVIAIQNFPVVIEGGPYVKADGNSISESYLIKLLNGVVYSREFIKRMIELVDEFTKAEVFIYIEYERQRHIIDQSVNVEEFLQILLEEGFELDEEFDEIADCYIYPKVDDLIHGKP